MCVALYFLPYLEHLGQKWAIDCNFQYIPDSIFKIKGSLNAQSWEDLIKNGCGTIFPGGI